jgi:hypothetical protein
LIFSVSKTIRIPNEWARSHWLLDYRFGFIKRGLAGELFGFLREETVLITILSAGILLLLYFLILKIALKTTLNFEKFLQDFILCHFSAFPIHRFSAHLIGYLIMLFSY